MRKNSIDRVLIPPQAFWLLRLTLADAELMFNNVTQKSRRKINEEEQY
jgi:hypothetical protein